MRKQLVTTVEDILHNDANSVLLLGDIGVFGFRNSFRDHPKRVYNIGILEQSTVSLAAGLAKVNLIPIVHTIAPFLVERSLEQLKDDFGYQKLNGNFVSVGASYDYAALGCTHHCPGDILALKSIPDMQIVLPGTSKEFDTLFRSSYNNGFPTYFRLSENENSVNHDVAFGKGLLIKKGNLGTVLVVGNMLSNVLNATKDIDVTILYYTTVSPFDAQTLKENISGHKIILCEPYYEGGLTDDIISALRPLPITIDFIGVPKKFLRNYGKYIEHENALGLSSDQISNRIKHILTL
jgi:transketolase